MNYTLMRITAEASKPWKSFEADTLEQACERHVAEWNARNFCAAVVLLRPDGVRHSFNESMAVLQDAKEAA